MTKHFFILGRNPELSKEEIASFLDARSRFYKEIFFEENILVLETKDDEIFNIQEFGGILQLGKIIFEGSLDEFQNYMTSNELIPSDKFSYQVHGNTEVQIIKDKFKQEKKKAILKRGRNQLKFQDGHKGPIAHTNFSIFFHEHKGNFLFGTAKQEYDYNEVKNRDMNKPERRESLAISPRLSKILINLSGAKPYDTLLDPFCGVGGILQEALLKKIHVHGIDNNSQAVKSAQKNFEWLNQNYNLDAKYFLEHLDSRKTPDNQFAAIATETPLGKLLKKKPESKEASKIIQNFTSFIIPILKRLKSSKKPKARIAITFPVIRDLHVDAQNIAEKAGLKVLKGPIAESRPDQFISRDIVVLG
jgi:tRNA G10  N-methylase Trm11